MAEQRPVPIRWLWRAPIHAWWFVLRLVMWGRYLTRTAHARPQPYLDWLRGKRVALVGNAQSLMDQNMGAIIDGHDVVIRFNHGYVGKPQAQGRRTDMLVLSCKLPEAQLRAHFQPRHVLWVTPKWWHMQPYSQEILSKLAVFPRREWFAMSRALLRGQRPSTGFVVVMHLVQTKVASELHLFGFDGGLTRTFYNHPSYQTPHALSCEAQLLLQAHERGDLVLHGVHSLTATEQGAKFS